MSRLRFLAVAMPSLLLAGGAVPALAGQAPAKTAAPKPAQKVSIKPASGREGTKVTITYPSALRAYPDPQQALIEDPGVHGYYFARDAGVVIMYDGRKDSKYSVTATAVPGSARKNVYEFTIPAGICGVILQPTQATVTPVAAGAVQGSPLAVGQHVTKYPTKSASGGKKLHVSLVGATGAPATFSLTCDKYSVSIKVKADPSQVSPLPGASTVTATLTAKGPAQAVVGANVRTPPNTPNAIIPIGLVPLVFTTDFGTMAPPSPAKLVTARDGTASVAVSSSDSGTATVVAVAEGLGDGRATVDFSSPEKKVNDPQQEQAQIASPQGGTADQCAADVQQRHTQIGNGLKGHPTHEIAEAIANSDAANPSFADCSKKKSGGGGSDTTPAMTSAPTGDPQLDGLEADANASAAKETPVQPGVATSAPSPRPNANTKKLLIGGLAAAGGVVAVAAGHGGASGGGTSTPSGSSTGTGSGAGGGTVSTKWDPTGANGTDSGPLTLQPGGCAGSDSEYLEKVTLNLNSFGAGSVTLNDNANFSPRTYSVSGVTDYNVTVTSQGTFSFFGAPVPGMLSISFQSNTQATVRETTNWGSCSNTYQGTVSR